MNKSIIILIVCTVLLSCNDQKEKNNSSTMIPKAKVEDSIQLWASKLSKVYDPREEFNKVMTRLPKINTDVIKKWIDSLEKIKLVVKKDATELAIFLPRYDCIWDKDTINIIASSKMLDRIMQLPPEQIKLWKDKLEKVHKNEISNLWINGFMATIDRIFSAAGYQEKQASVIFDRLNLIPQISIDTLASTLKIAKVEAALDIIQEDYLFNDKGFKQEVFFVSMDSLKTRIKNKNNELQKAN